MNFEEFREYCLGKPFVSEGFPFDQQTLVLKVAGKMFALSNVDEFNSINLKCDPEKAIELRETFAGIQPGYHMNKKHWNTVSVNEDVSRSLIIELIDHSYDLVFNSLPKKTRDELTLG
jgi:predicted DNA-binding protein (MmcQ/YjbR family)